MHALGKVFLALILLLAGASAVLTAKLVDIRQSYTNQIEQVEEAIVGDPEKGVIGLESKLETQRQALLKARGELARTMLGWDRYWTDVPVQVQNADEAEIIAEGLGSEQGVPADNPDLTLHAFAPVDEAGTEFVYVGPFRVVEVAANDSVLRLDWAPFGEEVDQWRDSNWRFRSMIPAADVKRFEDLRRELAVGQELLEARRANLQVQTQLAEAAEQQLEQRQKELLGDGQAKVIEGAPEYSEGLLATLEEEEEARNRALAEVDRLRRELKAAEDHVQGLLDTNKALIRQLPTATAPATARRNSER